jgi:hypothetical protein
MLQKIEQMGSVQWAKQAVQMFPQMLAASFEVKMVQAEV